MGNKSSNKSNAEYAYSMFAGLASIEINWNSFKRFSRYPGLVRKALGLLIDNKRLSYDKGYEVLDSVTDYSWNFTHDGKRTYFTDVLDVKRYVYFICRSSLGRELRELQSERNRLEVLLVDGTNIPTTLPIKIRKAG